MKIINENGSLSRELFVFLKYNQMPSKSIDKLPRHDENIYKEFVKNFNKLLNTLNTEDNKASSELGSIMSMFGFSRHYCNISGKPIIGRYQKIGSRIVSQEAYESYQIIQQMEKKEKREKSENINIGKVDKIR